MLVSSDVEQTQEGKLHLGLGYTTVNGILAHS